MPYFSSAEVPAKLDELELTLIKISKLKKFDFEKISNNKQEETEHPRKYNSKYSSQFYWLLLRQFRTDLRNPIATKVLLMQTIVIGAFLGLIFLQLANNQVGVQNKIGVLCLIAL